MRNVYLLLLLMLSSIFVSAQIDPFVMTNFKNPPADCWPHTRWWWPGNPVSKEEITRELEEMRSHGIRGVEQITMDPVYEKGNIPYLSDEFMEMLNYTVKEAKRLGMEVSFNFGGPGWIIGGEWVKEEDKSKDMVPSFVNLHGPMVFSKPLPDDLTKTKRSWERYSPKLDGNETLLAVIAGKVEPDGTINKASITNLTSKVVANQITWDVPKGDWRLMCFWLKKNGTSNAVDHFSKSAMESYCNYLGNKFYHAFGDEFGKTVESLFVDSFELANLASGINWSSGLLEAFKNQKGYDLVPYLPAIWWPVGDISPKIRYDVNDFLHSVGLNVFFKTFLGWCEAHHIKGRIQPYGFNTDNIEAAGLTHIPEMEITAGEKDAADWFDTRIGPRKYVESGAHLYGKKIISSEVYTFIHWERYRETLEELKIASDGYLLSGVSKFYNHGFNFSPEKEVSPTRSLPFAAYIQPQNVWWKYYPKLAEYIARCSWMNRQGDPAPDIAVYSPLANQWAINVLNPRKWTREFEWGEIGNLLIANGYDYDLINDDALQHIAKFQNGTISIQNMQYKLLILPNVETIPLKTLLIIERYVENGGVVIALERVPEKSTGLVNSEESDQKVKEIAFDLFSKPKFPGNRQDNPFGLQEPKSAEGVFRNHYGHGITYQLKTVLDRTIWWDKRSSTLDPFLETIRQHLTPDFEIDFAYEGMRKNDGLTFNHRKVGASDLYFVTNIQDKHSTIPVTFRVKNKNIRKWDPFTGEISDILNFSEGKEGIKVPIVLAPYESMILEFSPGTPATYVSKTDFAGIIKNSRNGISALAAANGTYNTVFQSGTKEVRSSTHVLGIPASYSVSGNWKVVLGDGLLPGYKQEIAALNSWVDNEQTKNFSGTGSYEIDFTLPWEYFQEGIKLFLDLGKVGNVAEVFVNGKNTGITWMRGKTLEVTSFLKKGSNRLKILVTNTLINRISAMKEPPAVPEYLVDRFGSAAVNKELPREFGFKPIPASGLMGPVRILAIKEVEIRLEDGPI